MAKNFGNHRKRLKQIAARRGVQVQDVANWAQLAKCLAEHHGIANPAPGKAKRFCYELMECLGWIARRAPAQAEVC